MFKFVQNCTYLIFLLIQALKILDGGGNTTTSGVSPQVPFLTSRIFVLYL